MHPETIAAPATPPGHGGVSLIRVSGSRSKKIALLITRAHSLKKRQPTLLPVFNCAGEIIDRPLVTFYKGPFSYTGENIVEFSCHGNPTITDAVLSAILENGARLAEPGEFTKRAFLNGKLDLLQAESVGMLIQAKSQSAIKMNNKILAGELSRELALVRESITGALVSIEFEFDISEDDSQLDVLVSSVHGTIKTNIEKLNALLFSYEEARLYNDGARVVICGKPNVGKSTLLNTLLGQDRAITSNAPGTTRDVIDSGFVLSGLPITIADTAGIRSGAGDLEADGIKRTLKEVGSADIIIYVFDSEPLVVDFIKDIEKIIYVFNKNDILKKPKLSQNFLSISAKNGTGISLLKDKILTKLIPANRPESGLHLTSKRQRDHVFNSSSCLKKAASLIDGDLPELEIVALELKDSINHLDALLGKTSIDDLLDKLFSTFCVGK